MSLLVAVFNVLLLVGWHSVLPYLSPLYFLCGLRQSGWWTLCCLAHLTSRWAGRLVHQRCPLSRISHARLFDWCNQLKLAKCRLRRDSTLFGRTFSSVHRDRSLNIPQSYVIWLGVDKVASYTSLCLLNLRASIDFHWERKKQNSQWET